MQAGTHLGPYEILTPLGAGGMGEVWRARDQRLHREVAVKILLEGAGARTPETLARFEREARAVAALSHPNILSIHDFGTHNGVPYAVMELLEGATLRERLDQTEIALARVLDWGHQIAQGLGAAHERGITHRDLKPENIFVTRDGVVKILDFGLARLEEAPQALIGQQVTTLARTSPGLIVGTIVYLSPEQARGEVADARSDIFAFGSVFYEMLSGKAAFLRDSAAETLVAILREEPKQSVDSGRNIPGEVQDILNHCLEKDANERFRTARDLAFALRLAARTASAPSGEFVSRTTPRPPETTSGVHELSIGVLPFRNMSPAADAEYFSDGMTEEIINSLSAVPGLHVAARTSSFAFKSRNDDIRKIGRDLGVAMVLEGSVRQSGARLRVSAQLVNVDNGYHLWSNRWDRDVADVFAVQDEIAEAIASTLKLRVVEKATGAGKTQNVDAYDRFLKGKYLLGQRRTKEAIVELDAAVAHDPDFADAYTAIADAWAVGGYYGGVPTWEAWARARSAVDEAQRIDPESAGVALSLGILEHYYGWNSAHEEQYLRQAIERNPKSADAWGWLSICYAGVGRIDEAIAAGERGIALEPHHANVRASQAWAFGFAGDFEMAERALRKTVEIDPSAGYGRWTLGYVLRFSGKAGEAVSIFEGLVEETKRSVSFYLAMLASALADAGEKRRAEEIVGELEMRRGSSDFVPSMHLAFPLAALGDRDAALGALERAREERNAYVWGLMYLPDFKPLRDNPRWRALAERLGRTAPVQGVRDV